MNCHHTVLRYGLQLERGKKGSRRSGKVMKATADSAGDRRAGGRRHQEKGKIWGNAELLEKMEKMRQRRRESECQAKVGHAVWEIKGEVTKSGGEKKQKRNCTITHPSCVSQCSSDKQSSKKLQTGCKQRFFFFFFFPVWKLSCRDDFLASLALAA